MTKRKTTETVYEYDGSGNLVRKTVTETVEEDDTTPSWQHWSYPVEINGGGQIDCGTHEGIFTGTIHVPPDQSQSTTL